MRSLSVETTIHGRVLVDAAGSPSSRRLLVAFHGYAQSAEDVLAEARRIPAGDWTVAAVQALHPFYLRDNRTVVASWMTRQDREQAIADNIAYVDRAIDAVAEGRIVYLGFSQGVAMAYRAGLLGRHAAAGIIALGGDIPPELKTGGGRDWPRVLIGAGDADEWYTAAKVDADTAFLRSRGVKHDVIRFSGGHQWTDEFRQAAGLWLAGLK